jgi:non-ribosomal peptide synthase protein (TIGR01720 family)
MVPHIFTHLEEMPLTSSGKINRNSLPEVDLNSASTETEYVAATTVEEEILTNVIATILNIEKASVLDNFFDIGGDSIKAIYIVSELEEMGYELHVADIMQNNTLSDVARAMKSISNKTIYDQNEVNGLIPFSPIMRAFLNENNTIPKDFVHTCIISADCDEDTARKALDVLVSHHDILRGTFCDNGIEIHPSNERDAYSFKAITIDDTDKAKEFLNDTRIDDNKLVNVVFCNTEKESLISITIHHFLIDLVSWEVLMKDFQTVIKQLKNSEEVSLPAKTASFMLWNEELQKYYEIISEENKEYWKNINAKLDNTKSLYIHKENVNEAEEYRFTLDENISNKLINEVNNTYGTRINEVLLTALGLAACEIADGSVGIIVESHGRTELHQPIAIERTVGWFTSCYPIVIDNNNNIADVLINTKETLRRIPKNGIDYLLLSEGFHKNTDIIFNFYHNSTANKDRKNKLIAFNSDSSVFPGKINVNCFASDNILTVNISVPKCIHKQKISEELGAEIAKQIEKIVDICTTTDTVIKTRSDFSDDELTEIELDELKDLFDWTDDNEQQY